MRRHRGRTCLAGAMVGYCLLLTGAASAQSVGEPGAPLAFDAEGSFDYDAPACAYRLREQAEVSQGATRLRADSVDLYAVKRPNGCGGAERAEARGAVFYASPEANVRANAADYDFTAGTAIFFGDVVVARGLDVSTADRLTIDLETGSMSMEGNVRAVIYPEARPDSGLPSARDVGALSTPDGERDV